ncbi:hypothetical protein TGDOM2_288670 [Toxoplasma gondii GAB2-2007-GAL-DOM2]|uniref:Uncharacterized protein n=5 Tax=Toxoplasma gondii TaxID=5811 RepID=S7UQA9_TOXGG|nr:hypothetical protein TGGT1_288670 [Toxoplasma gondii GT1]KAF4644357.1 hypothetical protein TGRH88_013500 [Toxoplasma gondii]KFG42828.1 hypothetical protein TGDOM2_288670 [Toxoplasma gondii GAB2-2007-GAL-DOM2]KFG53201.1 hypothetical protein TGFOU_288670 [Toxoplasma gondii FOU]RQX73864.1 hypothetical protein TGCAST_288670 [Toxoplasma gondii CAST]
MDPQSPANPQPRPLPLQLLQRHRDLLAQQLQGKQASPGVESPVEEKEKPTLPVVPPLPRLALLPRPLRPLTPEQQLQRQQLLQQHLRQRQLQHLQLLQQVGLRDPSAGSDPAAQQRALDLLEKELERQRQQGVQSLQVPARLLQLQIQQRLLLQVAAQRQQAAGGEKAPLRPPPAAVAAAAAAAAAAVRRSALQLLLMPRPAGLASQNCAAAAGAAATDNAKAEAAEAVGAASEKSGAAATEMRGGSVDRLPMAAPGFPGIASPVVAPLLAASPLWAVRPPSIQPPPSPHAVPPPPPSSVVASGTSSDGSKASQDLTKPAGRPSSGEPVAAASGSSSGAGTLLREPSTNSKATGGGKVKREQAQRSEGVDACGETYVADGAGPLGSSPAAYPAGRDGGNEENSQAGSDTARKKETGETVQEAMSESPATKGEGKKEKDEAESSESEEDMYRYHEEENASDAVKRRHTLEMPIGWGVRKPVAEATGSGAFKKSVWVNETVGGIRRQVYHLEKTKEWCVQFFRSSGSDTRTVTKKFPEDGTNRFRAIAAAYNLMPWDCTGTDYRRPQGRPLKRRVFTAADFEEGTAWCHYPPSLSRHPYPPTAAPGGAAAPGRPRRRADVSLLRPQDLGDTPQNSPFGSPSDCYKMQRTPDLLPHSEWAVRGCQRPGAARLASGSSFRGSSKTAVLGRAPDSPCTASHRRLSVNGGAPASAVATASRASPRLSPRVLDAAVSVAAAAFRLRKRRRDEKSRDADEGNASWDRAASEEENKPSEPSVGQDPGVAGQAPASGRSQKKRREAQNPDEGLFGWLCRQSGSDVENDGETTLLRQLILDQVEEESSESVASWSNALLPWPLTSASPCSTTLVSYADSSSPSSPSSAAGDSSSFSSRYEDRERESLHRELGSDAEAGRSFHTSDAGRSSTKEHPLSEGDPLARSEGHMVLPPAPCSSLSRLFCHFCCSADRREALGRRAFAKVVEVVFPSALEASLRDCTGSAVLAGHTAKSTGREMQTDLCDKLARREQTLENYVLISRFLRALAKKENDEFFRRLHTMFQAHVAGCTSSPAPSGVLHESPRPSASVILSVDLPNGRLPLNGESAELSADTAPSFEAEDRSEIQQRGTVERETTQTKQSTSGADSGVAKGLEPTQYTAGSDATAPVSAPCSPRCHSACGGLPEMRRGSPRGNQNMGERSHVEPMLSGKHGKLSGAQVDVGDGKTRARNDPSGVSVTKNTSGGCHKNGTGSQSRLREPTVTEVLRVLGWILDIDDEQEGMRPKL